MDTDRNDTPEDDDIAVLDDLIARARNGETIRGEERVVVDGVPRPDTTVVHEDDGSTTFTWET